MDLFVEIVYVFITIVLILVVLLQAGRGGGLGTALGGGASQGVFGGGGGADFLAKLTQGLAAGFMICAVYLAYASAHTGSGRLQDASEDSGKELFDEDQTIDYERIGEGTVLELPAAGAAVANPDEVGGGGEAPVLELPEAPEAEPAQDAPMDNAPVVTDLEASADPEPPADPA